MVGYSLNSFESKTPPSKTLNNPNNRAQEWVDTSSSFLSFQGTILCEFSTVSQEVLCRMAPPPMLCKEINPSGVLASVSVIFPVSLPHSLTELPGVTSQINHQYLGESKTKPHPGAWPLKQPETQTNRNLALQGQLKTSSPSLLFQHRNWQGVESLAWWSCGKG